MRRARILLVGLSALVVGFIGAALASAWLDWPSRTVESEVSVLATREVVWQVLVDFDRYEQWNPLFTDVRGRAQEGEELAVRVEVPDDSPDSITPEIFTLREERKLRWQERTLLPGVNDREFEVVLEPVDDETVRVFLRQRFEGILTPLNPTDQEQVGLDLMAEALKERAEEAVPGTTIRATETWLCDRPLEDYGELPIIVKSRIDNAAVQPQPVEAVTLSGPDCAGDGDPDTVDLVLEVEGDGAGIGPSSDAVKVKLGAHDVDISGVAECGAPAPGVRQNAIHVMLGYRVSFIDFRVGDFEAGTWTCEGADGALAIEEKSKDDPEPEDVVCVGCQIIAATRSLYIGNSVRSGARDSTFSSEFETFVAPGAEDPVVAGNSWRPLERVSEP